MWIAAGALLILTFVPGWAGAATTPRWALLSVFVTAVLTVRKWQPEFAWIGAFLIYIVVSIRWAPVQVEAIGVVWKFLILGGLFAVGSQCERLKSVFAGLAIGIGVNSVIVLTQYYGLKAWPEVTEYSGLFVNKNFGAEAAALVLVGCVYYRVWWGILAAAPTLYFGSRAAVLAIAVTAIVEVWRLNRWAAAAITVGLGAAVAYYFDAIVLNDSALQRLAVWVDVTDNLAWFGHGAGSYYILYPKIANYMNPLFLQFEHVHSDVLELVFEFGVGAALLLPILWRIKAHPVVVAFAVEACFGFPLYLPVTAAIFAFVAGAECRYRRALRADLLLSRVSILASVAHPRHFGGCSASRARWADFPS